MKNFVAGVIALVVGFVTVTVAAVMGLFIAVAALIARPFIRKKMATVYAEVENRYRPGSHERNATVIDGEYDDITEQSREQNQYCQFTQS